MQTPPLLIRIIIFCILICTACGQGDQSSKYLRWVGDSEFNPEMDSEEFQLCNSEYLSKQYFHFDKGLQYKGEKKELRNHFAKNYTPVESDQCGYVRIRFMVNCKGETGRFRIIESDENYNEREFDKRITDQLLSITKSLDGWIGHTKKDKPQDYYQYLIFKINKGQIIDIMP